MTPRQPTKGEQAIQDLMRVVAEEQARAVDSATKALREELKLADIASEQLAEQCARLNDEAIALEKRVDQAESVNRALMEALDSLEREKNCCPYCGEQVWLTGVKRGHQSKCPLGRIIARVALAAHEERGKVSKGEDR